MLATRNAAGQILSLADPKGNKRSYQYNADGLLTGFTDALGNKWTYDYDGAARPSSKTDPAGVTLKATYTAGNRIAGLTAGDTQTHVRLLRHPARQPQSPGDVTPIPTATS